MDAAELAAQQAAAAAVPMPEIDGPDGLPELEPIGANPLAQPLLEVQVWMPC